MKASGLERLAVLDQIHGADVVELRLSDARDDLAPCAIGDAAITRDPGLGLCIGSADCLPILIDGGTSGWVGSEGFSGSGTGCGGTSGSMHGGPNHLGAAEANACQGWALLAGTCAGAGAGA